MEKTKEQDLIEKIAYSLPLNIRAEFLNEMRYMRSLPENDEMLRILRVMMFLAFLTEQVPGQILKEREKMESACHEVTTTAKRLETIGGEYYKQLKQRLVQLPADIATCISPKAMVMSINNNLKKQFDMSTIPIVARELAANAGVIKTATNEYTQSTKELCDAWQSASDNAREAIGKIRSAISSAVETSEEATKTFTRTFRKTYHWMIGIITAAVLLAGTMIGILILDYFRPSMKTVYEIPYELLLLIESRQRGREQTPTPNQEAKPAPQRELMPIPEELKSLQELNIWKLVK